MKKILLIQTAFIGDVILATALIEKIAISKPDYKIHFLLRKGNESLLKNNPNVQNILIWDKANKYSELIRIIKEVRSNKYDKVVNIQRFFSTGLITALSVAINKIGFDKNPLAFSYTTKIKHVFGDGGHEIDRNLKLIEAFTNKERTLPKLYPSEEDFNKTKKTNSYITISPSSVWFTKQYPKDKWIEFLNLVPKELDIYILGGKGDFDFCNEIKNISTNQNIKVEAGELSFLESAALMKNAKMNYVNDSAPLHLCSAVDAPVTSIFCSTIPEFGFTPLSQQSFILETTDKLDCRPCGMHGKKECPKGHFKCGGIDTDRILETLK